jgi:hypothetical protein
LVYTQDSSNSRIIRGIGSSAGVGGLYEKPIHSRPSAGVEGLYGKRGVYVKGISESTENKISLGRVRMSQLPIERVRMSQLPMERVYERDSQRRYGSVMSGGGTISEGGAISSESGVTSVGGTSVGGTSRNSEVDLIVEYVQDNNGNYVLDRNGNYVTRLIPNPYFRGGDANNSVYSRSGTIQVGFDNNRGMLSSRVSRSSDYATPETMSPLFTQSSVGSHSSANRSHSSANRSHSSVNRSHSSVNRSHSSASGNHSSASGNHSSASRSYSSISRSHSSVSRSHSSVSRDFNGKRVVNEDIRWDNFYSDCTNGVNNIDNRYSTNSRPDVRTRIYQGRVGVMNSLMEQKNHTVKKGFLGFFKKGG